MAMKNVTISLPEGEYNELTQEALQPPYSGTLTDMCRAILRGRHEMIVQPSHDAERLKSYYEGKIELLQSDKADLLNRLSSADKSNGLAGLDVKEKKVGTLIKEAEDRMRTEFEQRALKEKFDELTERARLLTERNKELEIENASLQDGSDFHQKAQAYIASGSEALGALLKASPALEARVEQGGLAGLMGLNGLGGSPMQISGGSLTETQQRDLKLGQVIAKEFAGENYGLIVLAIRYMRDFPGVLASLTGSPKFAAWQQSKQAAQAA